MVIKDGYSEGISKQNAQYYVKKTGEVPFCYFKYLLFAVTWTQRRQDAEGTRTSRDGCIDKYRRSLLQIPSILYIFVLPENDKLYRNEGKSSDNKLYLRTDGEL
jgi:hypothetical protein